MRDPAVASATVEIYAHLFVLFFVLAPILIVVFPALILLVGATMLSHIFAPKSLFSEWIAHAQDAPFAIACMAALCAGCAAAVVCKLLRRKPKVNLRDLVGQDGERLRNLVADLWVRMGGKHSSPAIRWFPATDVAAYCERNNGNTEIQVSTGLWRSAISRHPAAMAILTHEMAHALHGDLLVLRLLEYMSLSLRAITWIAAALGLIAVATVLTVEVRGLPAAQVDLSMITKTVLSIVLGACTVLILIPLGWIALKRQISFITSLVEIRADIAAAQWTNGLENFTQAFADNARVIKSTNKDLLNALFSHRLTHIPQRERMEILNNKELVITPKIRFFAFSLLLAFIVPINFATPLLFGGAADYLASVSLSLCLNVSIVAMLIFGLSEGRQNFDLSVRRRVTIAFISCVVASLPQINIEPVSYLFMSWLVGFGGTPLDWGQLPHDFSVTAHDLSQKFRDALVSPHFLLAFAAAYLSISLLNRTACQSANLPATFRCIAPIFAVVISTLLLTLDSRATLLFGLHGLAQEAMAGFGLHRASYLGLPIMAAAFVDRFQLALGRRYLCAASTR